MTDPLETEGDPREGAGCPLPPPLEALASPLPPLPLGDAEEDDDDEEGEDEDDEDDEEEEEKVPWRDWRGARVCLLTATLRASICGTELAGSPGFTSIVHIGDLGITFGSSSPTLLVSPPSVGWEPRSHVMNQERWRGGEMGRDRGSRI